MHWILSNATILSQNSWWSVWELNQVHPKYKSRVLPLHQLAQWLLTVCHKELDVVSSGLEHSGTLVAGN